MAKAKAVTLRAHKETLMKRAREIARTGDCAGWEDVRRKFEARDAVILRLWATARDRDEIDLLCEAGRSARRVELASESAIALRAEARGTKPKGRSVR